MFTRRLRKNILFSNNLDAEEDVFAFLGFISYHREFRGFKDEIIKLDPH